MTEALAQSFLDWGYWGLFLAAFAAGSILPLGSEAVFVVLLGTGLDPAGCLAAATAGNTLGGMSCYWIGRMGKTEWIEKLGVGEAKLEKAKRFLGGRGALMAFFAFLPALGEAIAIVLGLMRANLALTAGAMCAGKFARYFVLWLSYAWAAAAFA